MPMSKCDRDLKTAKDALDIARAAAATGSPAIAEVMRRTSDRALDNAVTAARASSH